MTTNQNYFSLFAIPVTYDIDLSELTRRYRDLQKAVHPDKYASHSEQERLGAVQQAATVNDAFETLKSPLLRAQYLLELNGVVEDGNATISDPEFLMQQMEMRESLEDATNKVDALTAVEDSIDEIDNAYRGLIKKISEMFAAESPDYEGISRYVRRLQFFNRLKNEAEASLAEIENK